MDNETPITENIPEEIADTPATATDENDTDSSAPTDTADTGAATRPDMELLISEAEQRGYMRGLNEQAARMLDRPATGQQPDMVPASAETNSEVMILNRSKVSVWNK